MSLHNIFKISDLHNLVFQRLNSSNLNGIIKNYNNLNNIINDKVYLNVKTAMVAERFN